MDLLIPLSIEDADFERGCRDGWCYSGNIYTDIFYSGRGL